MNLFYLCLGTLLFAVTALDIIKTTFSSNGGGKVTTLVTKGVWRCFFMAAGKKGKSKLLRYAGPVILVSILLTWITGLWSGMLLVLLYDAGSIVNSKTMNSASVLEKLYYSGFTLSTLGVGDFIASSSAWRIITSVAAFSGLVFITASITYFVPVLSAVNLQSMLSLYISSMGSTPQQVLANSWNGRDFSSFFDNVSDLCQMLMKHTLNHHSYPVIHYFHNNRPKLSIAPAIVSLHETLLLLQHAVPQEVRGNEMRIAMLESALDAYLDMVKGSFLKNPSPKGKAPMPDLGKLEEQHIPLLAKDETRQAFSHTLHDRRMLLTAVLEMDGWSWQEVYGS